MRALAILKLGRMVKTAGNEGRGVEGGGSQIGRAHV